MRAGTIRTHTMKHDVLIIDGYPAVISYDAEMEMLRGEFIGLRGGADFYADNVEGLKQEGKISLDVYLEACQKDGIQPRRPLSGKLLVRISPEIHQRIQLAAAQSDAKSINAWVAGLLDEKTRDVVKVPQGRTYLSN